MDEKLLRKYGFTEIDFSYLMDEQRTLLEMELKKERPNKRVIEIIKKFSSVSKRVEGMTSYLKGYDVDTNAMGWIVNLYSSLPPSSERYKIVEKVIESYTRTQIWVGFFFSLVNTLNHALNLRRINAAMKIIRKMEKEVERSRKIFREFNENLRILREEFLGSREEEAQELWYFE